MHIESLHGSLCLSAMPLVNLLNITNCVRSAIWEHDLVIVLALSCKRLMSESTAGKFSGHGSILLLHQDFIDTKLLCAVLVEVSSINADVFFRRDLCIKSLSKLTILERIALFASIEGII